MTALWTQPAPPITLIFEDDFNGPAGAPPDPAVWRPDVWRSRNETCFYTRPSGTDTNAWLEDASLVLAARNEETPDGCTPPSPNAYTGARLGSIQTFAPTQDRGVKIAAVMESDFCSGVLPAFWLLGDGRWPACGEIDIMELPGHIDPFFRIGTIHGPIDGQPGRDAHMSHNFRDVFKCSEQPFTVGIDWYTNRIDWWANGIVYGTTTADDYTEAGGDWTPFNGTNPMRIILSLAVGNRWTGPPNSGATFPATTRFHWIRAWEI